MASADPSFLWQQNLLSLPLSSRCVSFLADVCCQIVKILKIHIYGFEHFWWYGTIAIVELNDLNVHFYSNKFATLISRKQ